MDLNGDLIALSVTHAQEVLGQTLRNMIARIQTLLPGELFPVDTEADPQHQFGAWHFSWYNRFSELVTVLSMSKPFITYIQL